MVNGVSFHTEYTTDYDDIRAKKGKGQEKFLEEMTAPVGMTTLPLQAALFNK
jgi:hypothetical protein